METNLIPRLHRMRDLGPDDARTKNAILEEVSSVLTAAGFLRLDTPVVELTELFVRKSGGEISSSLYSFSDPGGLSVSLRPEFTPSVIRWLIETQYDLSSPGRFMYRGPVFRYTGARAARFREFTQVGAELIGEGEPTGDTVILGKALESLAVAGLEGTRVRLGHIGVVRDLVRSHGLSEPVQNFVVSNLERINGDKSSMNELVENAVKAGLVSDEDQTFDGTAETMEGNTEVTLAALRQSSAGPTGRRTPEQIMTRLARKIRQAATRDQIEEAITSVARLVSSEGSALEIAGNAAILLDECHASKTRIDGLAETINTLKSAGFDESTIQVDFSFGRGMAYYTGIVFEFYNQGDGSGYPLGGGGRYDDLVSAFGGADTPACGFALNVDELASLSRRTAGANSE